MSNDGRWARQVLVASLLATGLSAATFLSAGTDPKHRYEIEIRGMAFHPADLTIAPGDTVVWVNRDIFPHSATHKSLWDTGTLTTGDSGRFIAQSRGEATYACTLHPTMTGKLLVK
ncbi:MAG: plastocyanin/azurin family copper-binding protein [Gemmatimonadota bacterium]